MKKAIDIYKAELENVREEFSADAVRLAEKAEDKLKDAYSSLESAALDLDAAAEMCRDAIKLAMESDMDSWAEEVEVSEEETTRAYSDATNAIHSLETAIKYLKKAL